MKQWTTTQPVPSEGFSAVELFCSEELLRRLQRLEAPRRPGRCRSLGVIKTCHRSQRGYDIPNKYPLYKVYMGLIINTISRGPHHFPCDTSKQNPQEIQKIFVDGDLCVCVWGVWVPRLVFGADWLKLNKLCLTKKHHVVFKKRGFSSIPTSHFWRLSPFFKGPRFAVFPPGAVTDEA